MAWLKFYEGQSAVNGDFIVSISVRGREDRCQVITKDILGEEHPSKYFKSFSDAEQAVQELIDALIEGPVVTPPPRRVKPRTLKDPYADPYAEHYIRRVDGKLVRAGARPSGTVETPYGPLGTSTNPTAPDLGEEPYVPEIPLWFCGPHQEFHEVPRIRNEG
jgi:hypothetical protein